MGVFMKKFLLLATLAVLSTSCLVIEKGTMSLSTSVENPKIKVSTDVQLKDVTPYTLGQTKNPQSDKETISSAEKRKMKYLGGVLFSLKGDDEFDRKSFKYPSKDMQNFVVVVKENVLSVCVPRITEKDLAQIKPFDLSFDYEVKTDGIMYEQTDGKDLALKVKTEVAPEKCHKFDLSKPVKKTNKMIFVIAGVVGLLVVGSFAFFFSRKKK